MEGLLLRTLGEGLLVQHISQEDAHFLVSVRSTAPTACCPLCTTPSASIHSQYWRSVSDLPCGGFPVRLHLKVRRFFCRNTRCARRIFTERLPDLVQPRAQMTTRLREVLRLLGFATCAEAASRLAPRFGVKGSPSTVLRCQKATPLLEPEPCKKIGLDDFAFRRGRTYGTLIVNLETHRPIEVLPDRSVATVTAWLAARPEIELISRDRASDYATAAALGAPQAVQVCDRWHLLRNLSEQVYTLLARMRTQIRKASQALAPPEEEDASEIQRAVEREAAERTRDSRRAARRERKTSLEHAKAARQAQRQDQYQQVLTLRERGFSSDVIAPRVGISARTVRQWLADGVDPKPRRRHPSPLDAYAAHLRRGWEDGQTAESMYAELQTRGYTGSLRAVYRYLNRWRPPRTLQETRPPPSKRRPRRRNQRMPSPGPLDACNAKQAVWWYIRSPDDLTAAEQAQLVCLRQVHPSLETAYRLVQAFVGMVRKREGERLEAWLEQARESQIPELVRIGRGVERDHAAVQAALQLPYSNGVLEGQVNRLKLLKRQGYGRAAFPLLRQRILYAAR